MAIYHQRMVGKHYHLSITQYSLFLRIPTMDDTGETYLTYLCAKHLAHAIRSNLLIPVTRITVALKPMRKRNNLPLHLKKSRTLWLFWKNQHSPEQIVNFKAKVPFFPDAYPLRVYTAGGATWVQEIAFYTGLHLRYMVMAGVRLILHRGA